MYKILSVFFSTIFLCFFVFAENVALLPQNQLASSNCFSSNKFTCPNHGIDTSQDCNNDKIDTNDCQAMQNNLLNTFKMFDVGNINTEGAYVRCSNENDIDSCTDRGEFSLVTGYSSASPNPLKVAHNKETGAELTDGNSNRYYCPMTRCDVRTDNIYFSYDAYNRANPLDPTTASYNAKIPKDTRSESIDSEVSFIVKQVGDNICVYASNDTGVLNMGCKEYKSLYVPPPSSKDSCFSNTACAIDGQSHSKVFWSVSSKIVECVRDALGLVFINDAACSNQNFLPGLQQVLRHTVMVAIVLYIILFGIKLATSHQLISKSEFFMLFFKIALVLYFSVGMKLDDGRFESGLSDFVYPSGLDAMNSFANFVMDASSAHGLCKYDTSMYDEGYEYLALWDSLDCRVGYYLGLYLIKDSGSGDSFESGIYGILGTIIPALLSLEIVFLILMVIYGIFILSIAVYFVHFYVIAMVAFAITVYVGVIIVPMALFSYTKQFFETWVNLLFSYILQPAIITVFMAFLLLVFDNVIYGNCKFQHRTVFGSYDSWIIDGSSCSDQNDPRCSDAVEECEKSIGWIFLGALDHKFLKTHSAIFFDYTTLGHQFNTLISLDVIGKLLKLLLFIYLLSLFAHDLGSFAASLTDGTNIGQLATDPQALFKKLMGQDGSKKKNKGEGKSKGSGKGISASGKARSGINVSG
ncbi:MAG: type IV secretion system protein [Alphaproteobacteria bacterium]|nr:type IV secretion system protein [Alphaproteobacteria bacterium]